MQILFCLKQKSNTPETSFHTHIHLISSDYLDFNLGFQSLIFENSAYYFSIFLCFSHKVQSGIWETVRVPFQNTTITLQSAITRWVTNTTSSIRIVDICIAAHCNPTCPDKLIFFDPAKDWCNVVRYFVAGLAMFVTMFCVGLKLLFMIYLAFVMQQQQRYNEKCNATKKRKEVREGSTLMALILLHFCWSS